MKNNNNFQSKKGIWLAVLMLIVVSSLFLSGCGGVQADTKVYRVGILSGLDYFADTTDAFKAGMTELGYVEGQNIVYDVQKTNVDMAAYKNIAKKFVADKVDLIFVFPTEATGEVKAATQGTNIPVVSAHIFTEGTGLVKSVREPGGNMTGVRFPVPDVVLKCFEVLHEIASQAKRMLVPYQRNSPVVPSQLEALRTAASAAGVTLVEAPADNAAELETLLRAQAKSADLGYDAILCIAEPLMTAPDSLGVVAKFSAERKLPIGGCLLMAPEGYEALVTAVPDNVDVGKRAASLADKVLRGTPAGTLPVLSPEPILRINYKMAQELGLAVPEGLLRQADEVIR
jgi:putative ABC transport system substrate-binding protein